MGLVNIDGVEKTRQDWCDIMGIQSSTVSRRMIRLGLTEKEALIYVKPISKEQQRKSEMASREKYDGPMLPIPNYTGYFATEDGRIWNAKLRRFLKLSKYKYGSYYRANLHGKIVYVHAIICMTYHGEGDGMWVQAKDNNLLNTHKDNLFWGTPKESLNKRIFEKQP